MMFAIPLAVMLGGFATWLLMRERTNAALHLSAYYRRKWLDTVPTVSAESDATWREFMDGHR